MNTDNEKTASRIYEIKSRLIQIEKQYDNSRINEERVKLQLELKKIEARHIEDPFIKVGKTGLASNE